MSFLDRQWLKRRYAELIVSSRHHPALKKNPKWIGEMKELRSILLPMKGENATTTKVVRLYESKVAQYSKLKSHTAKQAHTKAVAHVVKECELTPQHVRRILKEWYSL